MPSTPKLIKRGNEIDPLTSAVRTGIFLVIVFLPILAGCRRHSPDSHATAQIPVSANEDAAPEWFEDITEKSGLNFVHDVGPLGNYRLPEIMGSGAALFDFDNDGRLDVYLIQNGGPEGPRNQLFHQEANGNFRDVSAGSGLDVAGFGMGVAIGDVNNDGFPDVLLCEYGGIRLFLNKGNGTFTEVTRDAGLAEQNPANLIRYWATAATLMDYDRSGRLSLAVVSYLAYDPSRLCSDLQGKRDYCGPGDFPGSITRLYKNVGWEADNAPTTVHSPDVHSASKACKPTSPNLRVPRFEDVTAKAGLSESPSPALGVVAADFDGDGWPDLLVANDNKPNQLWINRHDGTFKDAGAERGIAFNAGGSTQANMGIALGDVNGNGLVDVYITHLTDENNTLWLQSPSGYFTDQTAGASLMGHGQGTGFGTVLADFDLDGSLDLAVVNGRVARSPRPVSEGEAPGLVPYWRNYAERNQLFKGNPQGHFKDVAKSNLPFCGIPNVARGLASGDLFNDGSISLLVTNVAAPARVYRNTAKRRGNWLEVRAIDPALGGRDVYGSMVEVCTPDRSFTGWVNPGGSYLCSSDPRVHFGLGSISFVEKIIVTWPDGIRENFLGGLSNRLYVVRKGSGSSAIER